ncbi:hypothetical protein QJV44_gp26 [Serratia phage vB_SmaS_Tlacuache]|uniref:Uncharacterized protein n=1 Tax=Serratia phage vB_SmaS_Tlacuache TaxID=2894809 RepID=A0AAE8YVA6_9CAUD|nr:hypothetical protein QJV44_gp26 [Serratia phage vB_SmaS_Tlacuache]UGO51440.1 hypothetical protein TLACUACHE_26 [Serratia phage vB_SmaS_Tlacuache]
MQILASLILVIISSWFLMAAYQNYKMFVRFPPWLRGHYLARYYQGQYRRALLKCCLIAFLSVAVRYL